MPRVACLPDRWKVCTACRSSCKQFHLPPIPLQLDQKHRVWTLVADSDQWAFFLHRKIDYEYLCYNGFQVREVSIVRQFYAL